jgi:hypothetical protein
MGPSVNTFHPLPAKLLAKLTARLTPKHNPQRQQRSTFIAVNFSSRTLKGKVIRQLSVYPGNNSHQKVLRKMIRLGQWMAC